MGKANRARQRAAQLREQRRAAERRRRAILTTVAVVAFLLIAGGIGYGVYVSQQPEEVMAPRVAVDDDTGLAVGDGPVTVELYVDFLCPHCKEYEEATAEVLDEYLESGRITLVYHPVNFLDPLTSTRYSTRAAAAAAIAAEEGKLREYATALFANQPPENSEGLTDDQLIEIGRSVGLTSDAFAEAVRSDKYHDWVSYVARQASRDGVRGTPTVLVNGKQVEELTPEALRRAIESA